MQLLSHFTLPLAAIRGTAQNRAVFVTEVLADTSEFLLFFFLIEDFASA